MRVYEPGQRGAPAEVDDVFARRGVDVGAPAGERHPAVAHDQRVGDRPARVERVDPAVGQEQEVTASPGRRG